MIFDAFTEKRSSLPSRAMTPLEPLSGVNGQKSDADAQLIKFGLPRLEAKKQSMIYSDCHKLLLCKLSASV
jgi:hypothetical protein